MFFVRTPFEKQHLRGFLKELFSIESGLALLVTRLPQTAVLLDWWTPQGTPKHRKR